MMMISVEKEGMQSMTASVVRVMGTGWKGDTT